MSLALRLIDEPAAHVIVAGQCPPGLHGADDYPAEGDAIAAGLFLQCLEIGLDPRPFGAFMVVLIEDGVELVIGGAGFHSGVDEDGRVEIGYGIVPSKRGRGYATRAVEQLVELARELGAVTLLAETAPENAASQDVLARCGFARSSVDDHAIRYELALSTR